MKSLTCFAVLALTVATWSGQNTALGQDANMQIRGGCEILDVRNGPAQTNYSFCDKLPSIQYGTYGWLVPVLTLTFDNAERATCSSLRCATGARRVDLLVTKDAFATAGVFYSASEADPSGSIIFFLTTGLADMIQASITGYLFQSSDPTNGFQSWLSQIDARVNSDCRFIVPAPFRSLNQEEIKMVFVSTNVMYQFVLGHEFAHVILGPACKLSQGNALAQEAA